jgi:hypothetical protein
MAANTPSFQDLLDTAEQLGKDEGAGKEGQIKFLLKVAEGGYHSTLDLAPNKHGTEVDDATKLVEGYMKGRQQGVVFDTKAMNTRVRISEARTGIKLGGWPKGGNGEPIATINNLLSMRQKLAKIPAECKKLDDARNTFLRYARAQLKRDTLIDDAELKEFCYKRGRSLPTAEDIIGDINKKLSALLDGTAASKTVQDNSTEIRDARQLLRKRLSDIATARGKAKGPNTVSKPVTATVTP